MTELLAVLTSIFVVYLLYEIFKTVSESDQIPEGTVSSAVPAPVVQTAEPEPPPAPAPRLAPTPPKKEAPTATPAPAVEPAKITHLRNPSTGEVSPVPGNYRFAKKWIKEAMVAEGLLNKVYKNSELTEAVNPKLRAALEQFKQLEQYHA